MNQLDFLRPRVRAGALGANPPPKPPAPPQQGQGQGALNPNSVSVRLCSDGTVASGISAPLESAKAGAVTASNQIQSIVPQVIPVDGSFVQGYSQFLANGGTVTGVTLDQIAVPALTVSQASAQVVAAMQQAVALSPGFPLLQTLQTNITQADQQIQAVVANDSALAAQGLSGVVSSLDLLQQAIVQAKIAVALTSPQSVCSPGATPAGNWTPYALNPSAQYQVWFYPVTGLYSWLPVGLPGPNGTQGVGSFYPAGGVPGPSQMPSCPAGTTQVTPTALPPGVAPVQVIYTVVSGGRTSYLAQSPSAPPPPGDSVTVTAYCISSTPAPPPGPTLPVYGGFTPPPVAPPPPPPVASPLPVLAPHGGFTPISVAAPEVPQPPVPVPVTAGGTGPAPAAATSSSTAPIVVGVLAVAALGLSAWYYARSRPVPSTTRRRRTA